MINHNRILLKISGESLMGNIQFGLDIKMVDYIANEIKEVFEQKYQVCLIIGGGNIFRGIKGAAEIFGYLEGFAMMCWWCAG